MENQKTHWRNLTNEKYLGHWDLEVNGSFIPVNVTIEKIYNGEFIGEMGKEQKPFVKFKEYPKAMLINKTNFKRLELAFKSFKHQDYVGGIVTLKVEKVKAVGGTMVDALRISSTLPVLQKPELTPTHEKWMMAIAALRDNKTTIDKIMETYILSPENKMTLESIKPTTDDSK
jgi:hypothetical protein